MAKKAQYYQIAEQLFVYDHLSVADIAEQLPVSDRTIGDWRRDGNWDARRDQTVALQTSTTEKLHKLVDKLIDNTVSSIEDGTGPSQSQLYLIGKLTPALIRMQKFEETVTTTKPAAGVTEETLSQQKQVLQEMQETLMRLGLA
jgi:hypothetical protein